MKKVLLLGDSGLVGREIINQFKDDYDIYGLSRKRIDTKIWDHIKFDLEKENISNLFPDIKPDIIISCTRGDFEKQLHIHKQIADYCRDNKSRLYYFSTANVFDGNPDSEKYEDEKTCSESDYGNFKIACENLLKDEINKKVIIIRPPMIFGQKSKRVDEIKSVVNDNKPIELYKNLYMTTIIDVDLIRQLKYIIENDLKGIFHIASNDIINHVDFYRNFISEDSHIKLNKIENYEKYYLAIKTKRKELVNFQFSNNEVVNKIKEYLSE